MQWPLTPIANFLLLIDFCGTLFSSVLPDLLSEDADGKSVAISTNHSSDTEKKLFELLPSRVDEMNKKILLCGGSRFVFFVCSQNNTIIKCNKVSFLFLFAF
jgi:hypothetical protein